ncbi:hypothetical protein DRO64_01130 [Candidatus Bathyarchaeota archaeon]|nr:MAG: hypothetical protein DRO64_01130 [Candidatus Bathyarchaeota archaeon]
MNMSSVEEFLDDRTLQLLQKLSAGETLSSIIQDKQLRELFNNNLEYLISRLHMLAALRMIEYDHLIDDEESDDVKIVLTSLGRNYLEAKLRR